MVQRSCFRCILLRQRLKIWRGSVGQVPRLSVCLNLLRAQDIIQTHQHPPLLDVGERIVRDKHNIQCPGGNLNLKFDVRNLLRLRHSTRMQIDGKIERKLFMFLQPADIGGKVLLHLITGRTVVCRQSTDLKKRLRHQSPHDRHRDVDRDNCDCQKYQPHLVIIPEILEPLLPVQGSDLLPFLPSLFPLLLFLLLPLQLLLFICHRHIILRCI